MKKLIKRYGIPLLLIAANVVIGLIVPDIGAKSLELTKQNIIEMISVIPPIFVLLGLLDVWVDRATMMKYTGKGSGIKGVLLAFFLGSAAAGPLYAAFPVAGVMLKKGSSLFNVFVFVGAWSTTKIPMLTFEAASMGPTFMLVRLGLSIIGILIIAAITEKSLDKEQRQEVYDRNQD
ncbi:MAG TPA: permease [Oscillospiraceae bacterium]|nr:permease [Oscillospiraceae bacterium]HPF55596.1 permease [Clostridiales bacterium]HPK35831.1 permease [Oscillospiraceae bacterium]